MVELGPIGLLLAQVVRQAGATRVLAVEPLEHRLKAAVEFGAEPIDPPDAGGPGGEATSVGRADVVFESAVRTPPSTPRCGWPARAPAWCRPASRTGIAAGSPRRSPAARGLTLVLVRRMHETYPLAVDLVTRAVVNLPPVVCAAYPLERTADAMAAARRARGAEGSGAPSVTAMMSGGERARENGAKMVSSRRMPVMNDVARLAGVSHMTVSRVLNDPESVRPETRERVQLAIEQLGYRRNSAARSLVTRRSQTLGVVCFDTTLYGPASTLNGIEYAAEDAGYAVSVASLRRSSTEAVGQAVQRLVDQAVEGLILIAPQSSAAMAFFRALPPNLPVVAVESALPNITSVSVDQAGGARMLTEHLLALGHVTVHHVRGPGDWAEANGRVEGWLAALEAAGRPVARTLSGDWSALSGYEAGQKIAKQKNVTAVFVANDSMAMGLLRALHEAGVRVPEDISVVGFDDIPEAAYMMPPLTTVKQPFREVGRCSISTLLAEVEGEGGASTVIPPELIVRQSTAAPR